MKIGVGIRFLSAGNIDILKALVNSTPFFGDNEIYENRGRKQCFSTGYINIHKKLVNSTLLIFRG